MRVLPCIACGHMHGSHYVVAPRVRGGSDRAASPRGRSAALPCHITGCTCRAFLGVGAELACAICGRRYTTQSSLQNHLYGRHPGLNDRERSELVAGAIRAQASQSPWEFEAFREMEAELRTLEELAQGTPTAPGRRRARPRSPPDGTGSA